MGRLQIFLVPLGTLGDVAPFLALGKRLTARGHTATLMANPVFGCLAKAAGLAFLDLGRRDDYEAMLRHADLWHPRKGLRVLMAHCVHDAVETLYDMLHARYQPGNTVVVAAGLAFGARLAHEVLGVPLATVHLQPFCLRSLYRSPLLRPSWAATNALPRGAKRVLFRLVDAWLDSVVASPVNRLRARLGLPPVRRILADWWHSPELILGLFPDVFGPWQPDWPRHTVLTGFPYHSETEVQMPSAAEDFLRAGEPPIVCTAGTHMQHAAAFFTAAVDACHRLQRRGIVLTRWPQQLPPRLPDVVRHFDYLPLAQLLPRSAAVVHHGGVGTLAQALAAGIPQLVCPRAWDQTDNAVRLQHLGVAYILWPWQLRGAAMARRLATRLASSSLTTHCKAVADTVRTTTALDRACDAIERLVRHAV